MSEEVAKELAAQGEKEQKEFDEAWEEDTPTAGTKTETPKEDPTPPETKADEGSGKETQQVAAPEEDPIPDPAPPVETQEAKALRDELERERQKTKSWEGRIRAANERAKKYEEELERIRQEQEKTKETTPASPEDKDDEEAVRAFQAEFPDLKKPIIALVKKEILPLVQSLVKAELARIEPVVEEVKTIKRHIEVSTEDTHLAAITKAHPDWENILSSGELDKFIESQPSYVRKALEQVKASGDTTEVIDMFSQYKDWKNPKPKTQTPPKDPVLPKDEIEDELAVPANPGGPRVRKKVNKDDFDSAWEEANKQG